MSTQQKDGITLMPNGSPFATEKDAAEFLSKRKMDSKRFIVVPYPPGKETFAVADVEVILAPKSDATAAPATQSNERRYWRMQFHEKTDPNATDKVELTHNGDTLIFERGIPVICPETHRHIADLAVHNIYRMVPGEDRKVVSPVRTYPYQLIGPATEEEYRALLAVGNEVRDRAIEMNRAQTM